LAPHYLPPKTADQLPHWRLDTADGNFVLVASLRKPPTTDGTPLANRR
jgi:hypothetical protein